MSQCDNIPTLKQLQDVATNSNVLNESVTSDQDLTPTTATDGEQKKTLAYFERQYNEAIQAAGGVPLGTWSAGVTYNAYNEYLVYNGIPYKPAPSTSLPYTTQGADPTVAPDAGLVVPFAEVQASDLVTVREDLLGPGTQLFMGDDGESVKVGDTVPVGTTHLRVEVGGSPTLVKMFPELSGSVSTLNRLTATIGGVNVKLKYSISTPEQYLIDYLTGPELSQLESNDPSLDLSDILQHLMDLGDVGHLHGDFTHYCGKSLYVRNGSKLYGSGSGTNQLDSSTIDQTDTKIVFTSITESEGFVVSDGLEWITNFELIGFTVDHATPSYGFNSFDGFSVLPGSFGAFNGSIKALVRNCKNGLNIESNLFNLDLDLRAAYCYKSVRRSAEASSTSLSGWVKASFCFHGVELHNTVYSPLNFWFDQCGLSAPDAVVNQSPSDETPILLKVDGFVGQDITVGVERCRAQLINSSGYTSLSVKLNYQAFSPEHAYYKDALRTSNVPIDEQGLIKSRNSQVRISSVRFNMRTGEGYPAADELDPTYFYTPFGPDALLTIDGSQIVAENYCAVPVGGEKNIKALQTSNAEIGFGAESVNKLITTETGLQRSWQGEILRYGVNDSNADEEYHRIYRNEDYSEGDLGLEVVSARFASGVRFLAVNEPGYNSSLPAAMLIPRSSTSGRSINAGGTINASGADYAEYIKKSDGCGILNKGDIVGIDANGELTDKFGDAISFCVKSTNPSVVGNDVFIEDRENMPTRDLYENQADYLSALNDFNALVAHQRSQIDRVAFCGQSPINYDFDVGHYVIATADEIGKVSCYSTENPSFEEYLLCVGKVVRKDKGKSVIIVKVS